MINKCIYRHVKFHVATGAYPLQIGSRGWWGQGRRGQVKNLLNLCLIKHERLKTLDTFLLPVYYE